MLDAGTSVLLSSHGMLRSMNSISCDCGTPFQIHNQDDPRCSIFRGTYQGPSGPGQSWEVDAINQARIAFQNENGFLEIELEVGSSIRKNALMGDTGSHTKKDFTGILSEIEKIGWRLVHVGYYFMITGETSRAKVLSQGENTAVSGKTMGVYLFRNKGSGLEIL